MKDKKRYCIGQDKNHNSYLLPAEFRWEFEEWIEDPKAFANFGGRDMEQYRIDNLSELTFKKPEGW